MTQIKQRDTGKILYETKDKNIKDTLLKADFKGANLSEAILILVNFTKTKFNDTKFDYADLDNTIFD
ncbi:MAG: hypothetical protein ACI8VT_002328 [Saprospiraceae bacterium]|jgi:uncharacterized protein YjbI with pentapeptide repeats